ncbi:MAG: hypothetical protein V4712_08355 [Pseudomonadota bacterium]
MSDNSSFFALVNASPALADRFANITVQVITAGRELFGVQLDHEDVASMVSARASALGAHPLEDYMGELKALDKVKQRLPQVAKPDAAAPAVTSESVNPDGSAGYRDRLRRINEVRKPTETQPTGHDYAHLSDVEKLRHLQTLPPGDHRKISLARAWGLIPAAAKNGY